MSFVSYAQNFEDVMLWRALLHVENGTYVDVGAQDPVVDSVSRAFFEHGWRGVHIEPVPFYADRLRKDRPGETVLQAALGENSGTLALKVIPGTGLSTAVEEHARRHHEAGFEAEEVHVPMLTLASALGMLAGSEVHWLKIDVEGFEEAVLKGWDSSVLRPWIMVIEATIPGSFETDYDRWEPIVLGAGYRFVYFDGLNRFYVADEHAELASAFAAPPNVFDAVELSGQASWGLYRRVEAQQQGLLDQSQARVKALEQAIEHALDEQRAALAASEATLAESAAALAGREATLAECQATLAECQATLAKCQEALAEREAEAARHAVAQARSAELTAQLTPLRQEKDDAHKRIAEMQATIHDWWSVADGLNREVQALRASTSWRITAPLRALRELAAGLPGQVPRVASWTSRRVRVAGRPLALWTMRTVLNHPGLRTRALRVLARRPELKQTLRGFAGRAGLIAFPPEAAATQAAPAAHSSLASASSSPAIEILPPSHLGTRAGRIYGQLKRQSS